MEGKNISTRRKVAIYAIGLGLIVCWLIVFDKVWPADSAVPPAATSARALACNPDGPAGCPVAPKKSVKRFRHDKLGRSTDYRLSKHVVRLVNRWYRHHPNAFAKQASERRDVSDWFKSPLQQFQCATFRTVAGDICHGIDSTNAVKRDAAKMLRKTVRVSVRCGGAVIIGYGVGIKATSDPRKALWGAGGGGTVCLWNQINDNFW
jgi:hypothetical protein